jgi:hypothetical protein
VFEKCPLFIIYVLGDLTFKQPTFAYANACKETPLEIDFIYLGNKDIYCIFKTWLMHLCKVWIQVFLKEDMYESSAKRIDVAHERVCCSLYFRSQFLDWRTWARM